MFIRVLPHKVHVHLIRYITKKNRKLAYLRPSLPLNAKNSYDQLHTSLERTGSWLPFQKEDVEGYPSKAPYLGHKIQLFKVILFPFKIKKGSSRDSGCSLLLKSKFDIQLHSLLCFVCTFSNALWGFTCNNKSSYKSKISADQTIF